MSRASVVEFKVKTPLLWVIHDQTGAKKQPALDSQIEIQKRAFIALRSVVKTTQTKGGCHGNPPATV